MPVYMDVESRVSRRALEATASELRTAFGRLGSELSGNLGSSMSKALGAFDTGAARAELAQLERAWTRAADVEAEAARRMVSSARQVEVAQQRAAEMSAKYTDTHSKAMAANAALADTQAKAARDQRVYTDALVANEAAHKSHTRALQDSAATASMAGRAFNAAGIGGLAVFTGTVLESTKAAGDFQQSQQRLVSSAGETAQGLKTVSDGILKLAGQVGYSSQELSNGMYTVEKAGYRGADGVKVLTASAQLARAENADLGEVLKGLTTSMHDFGYSQDQAALVASKMNTAVGLGKTNLQEFSGALASVEPIAAGAHISLDDVYGSLAQITQSGTSADRAAQNMGHSISQLVKPSQQMRDEMAAMGLDARDVSAHLGERGYAGTVQMLSDTIRAHMNPAQQVVIDTMFKSTQATDAANQMFNNLPPAAKAVAQSIKDGTLSYKDFRKSRGGLDVEQANEINQWNNLNNKVTGYSNALKTGQGDIQTYEQALALMTGGQDSLRTVLQLVGDNAGATNDKIKQIKDTTQETDGTVKGFNETQQTLNAKMADAKAAFGAAAIEIGSAFVPFMTSAANVAKDVGDFMGRHPAIMHDVVDAIGLMGGAWLTFKGYQIASAVLTPIVGGLGKVMEKLGGVELQAGNAGTAMRNMGGAAAEGAAGVEAAAAKEVLAEQGVRDAAIEADGAMAAGGAGGIGGGKVGGFRSGLRSFAGSLPIVGTTALALHDAATNITPDNDASNWTSGGLVHTLFGKAGDWITGKAGGGPLDAPGPKGRDSALFWGAKGEHVLTAADVDAMGGHGNVHAFRNALHRAGGGPLGPDVEAAESMAGTPYSQGARNDCSGMVGRVVNAATGRGGGLPTTRNMGEWLAARGFQPGIGGPGSLSVGWYNHGSGPNAGHAAMTLSDGENAESGGSHGNFLVGGSVGASSSQFDHHMFLANPYGEGSASGGGGFGGMGGGGFGGGFGGGIPAGSTAGRGPAGQAGYYTPNPERVASAQEQLRHINAEIATAEERKANLKSTASQAQKDRLDEEIRHLKSERDQAEGRLHKAERGSFHQSRGGRGGGGSPFLPVPLAGKFGLDKGLPGVAEWAVGFLEDLVLGPLETGAMAAMNGGLGGGGALPQIGAGGGIPGLGGAGAASTPGDLGADAGARSAGDGAAGGSGGATAGSGQRMGQWWGGNWKSSHAAAPAAAPAPGAPATNIGQPFPLPTDPSQWGTPPISGTQAPEILGLYGPALSGPPGQQSGPLNPLQAMQKAGIADAFAHGAPPQTPLMSPFDLAQNPLLQHHAKGGPVPQTSNFDLTGTGEGGNGWGGGGSGGMRSSGTMGGPARGIAGSTAPPSGAKISGPAQHHARGGPSGTDTIPSWLSPGEEVEQKSAVDKYGAPFMEALNQGLFDPSIVQYHGGGGNTDNSPPPAPALPPSGPINPGTMKLPGPAPQPGGVKLPGAGAKALPPSGPGQNGQAGAPGSAPTGATPAGSGDDVDVDKSNLATPGATDQRPGAGLPASPGLGISGGLIGAAEGAASSAAGMAAGAGTFGAAGGAASSAMNLGFQELNRAASAGAQAAGVGVEGLLETVIPDSSGTGGDWMKTIPGRLLSGVAGARPAGQNTAGQTQPAVAGGGQQAQYSGMGQQGPANGGVSIENLHVQADNHQGLVDSLNSEAAMAGHMMGSNSGYTGGRGSDR